MTNYSENRNILQQYLSSIQEYDTLSFEEEQECARRWKNHHDTEAQSKMINSHLRLVVKVAISFKGYGLPMSEVIQEGNIGLMHAVARFDPDRGYRLSTYAMWWIRASIQEYVLNSWSLVKIGTTSAQKKLFFNLRKIRNKLKEFSTDALTPEAVEFISGELNVKKKEVRDMDQRMMSGDQSLNSIISSETGSEWQDWLVEDRPNQEVVLGDQEVLHSQRQSLENAIGALNEREREIFVARRLTESEDKPTLEDLSQHYGISRERVRQLEARAFKKVQKFIIDSGVAA